MADDRSIGPPVLEAAGLTRRYPGGGGVEAVDLAVAEGERLAIVGPSGSGKTTLLRLIAGLEPADAGTIAFDGRPGDRMSPRQRGLAMAFQHQPPYPHLNVARNLGFGLRARGRPRTEIRERVAEVAGRLGLADLLDRKPAALSGGQRQRVVLGRVMASRPRLALLDEPFSALDPPLRRAIRADLAAIHDRQGGAVVLVTHDQAEALAFGHRLVVLRDGRVEQSGTPAEVYDRPASAFVAAFLGDPGAALLRVAVRIEEDLAHVEKLVPGASWAVPRGVSWVEALAGRAGPEVDLALRPEHVEIVGPRSANEPTDGPTVVVQVERVESLGPSSLIEGRLGAHCLSTRSLDRPLPAVGDRLLVRLLLSLASWYDPTTGRAVNSRESSA